MSILKPVLRDPSDASISRDNLKKMDGLKSRGPLLWRRFNFEATSKASKFGNSLIHKFVSFSVPAGCSHWDMAEQIAAAAHITFESLPDALKQPVFVRARVAYGFAGDLFDDIAGEYENMQWWLSNEGLNIAVVSPANPPHIPTFGELVSDLMLDSSDSLGSTQAKPERHGALLHSEETLAPKENRKTKKPVRRNEKYEKIDKALRQIANALPNNHEEVFQFLDARKVEIPGREPFKAARGWMKGFQQKPHAARAWLSPQWKRLNLPAFARGPKK